MKKVDFSNSELIALNYNEMLCIDGGEYDDGYAAGEAAGAYVRKIVDGVAILRWIFL